MKTRFIIASALAVLLLASCTPKIRPAIPQDKEMEAKIEKILKDMTLEEKVGQMTQITITALGEHPHADRCRDALLRA